MGHSVVADVQFGHFYLVCIKYLRKLPEGYSARYLTVVSTYRIIQVFQLPFNTKQRLERAVTDVRREMN